MKNLFLKKRFIGQVISGKKTQTIRLKTHFKKGDEFKINFREPTCVVDGVVKKPLDEVTEAEAKSDGFESRAALMQCINEIYPDASSDTIVCLISFHVISQQVV